MRTKFKKTNLIIIIIMRKKMKKINQIIIKRIIKIAILMNLDKIKNNLLKLKIIINYFNILLFEIYFI